MYALLQRLPPRLPHNSRISCDDPHLLALVLLLVCVGCEDAMFSCGNTGV
jgi:hypothetical protein